MSEVTYRLAPEDEYTHTPEAASNYNESMYLNMFDHQQKIGGWLRLGNRPNEGYAELSVCLYLPGGRVGFISSRPKIDDNSALNAGGLRIEVIEPFKRLQVSYDGDLLILANPLDMMNPSQAFKTNPRVHAKVNLAFQGLSPMVGGERIQAEAAADLLQQLDSFSRAHYEQHVSASGRVTVGSETFDLSGFGLRDKSWGPRHWQAIPWYRWCTINFGTDFGMLLTTIGTAGGGTFGGQVFKNGRYDTVVELSLETQWDDDWFQRSFLATVKTKSGENYSVTGRVLSLIPLRHSRTDPSGNKLLTRIAEGFTEYRCNDQIGYGMSEYLDQIVDGRPIGSDIKV